MAAKARFEHKLLVGVHEGPDFDYAAANDNKGDRPTRRYSEGETVWDNSNLVEKLGAGKFSLVRDHGEGADTRPKESRPRAKFPGVKSTTAGDNPTPGDPTLGQAPSSFPHGQVSTGKQATTTLPDGRTVSGPAEPTDEEAEAASANAENVGGVPTPGGGNEDDESADAEDEPELDAMTVAELKQYAADEEIELHGASRKDEIVKAIRKARKA